MNEGVLSRRTTNFLLIGGVSVVEMREDLIQKLNSSDGLVLTHCGEKTIKEIEQYVGFEITSSKKVQTVLKRKDK